LSKRLGSLIIFCDERCKDAGSRLQICRAEAKRKERTKENIRVLVVQFIPELGCYVCVYELPERGSSEPFDVRGGRKGRRVE